MAKDLISVRLDHELKIEAEQIYSELGINMSDAIRMFIKRTISYGGIPFDLRVNRPNAETAQVLRDINNNKNISKTFDTPQEMFENLDNA